MDPLWYEFRSSPTSYLINNKTNVEALVHDLLQILYSEDKSNLLKLNVLSILQECVPFLLDDLNRLELVLVTLKNIFEIQRNQSDPLFVSQVLVTVTTILVYTEYLENVQQFLIELVSLLLEIIEKITMETNRLLRATACDCLKELELAIPGLLCDTVGHIYGMCLTENSFIHQNYMVLFSTILCHCVQKVALLSNESSSLPVDENGAILSLSDVLFHSGKLLGFEPPAKYWKLSRQIFSLPFINGTKLPDNTDQSEVRKAIAYLIDHSHLFTAHIVVEVVSKVVRIISCTDLSPMMLKSLLLRYTSSFDIQLCHIILLLKLLFSDKICDDRDEDTILRRLILLSGHPSLPSYQCALAMQWLLYFTQDAPEQIVSLLTISTPLEPSIFDPDEIVWYKILALSIVYQNDKFEGYIQEYFKSLLGALQKPVLYAIKGTTSLLLYRCMLLFCQKFGENMKQDIERTAIDILIAHAGFTQQSIDLMSLIDEKIPNGSSMSSNILTEACQWLLSLEISALCEQLEDHLSLCIAAAKSKLVRPQIPLQMLKKIILESPVCEEGNWNIGNAVLSTCSILMKVLPSNGACKELADLLLIISKTYKDIDIRDRARIYLQILLTVSSEKLSALMCETDVGRDLSQVVEARISNNEYPQPNPIKSLDGTVITVSRVGYCHYTWSDDTPIYVPEQKVLSVDEYMDWLDQEKSSFMLRVPCTISLSNDKPEFVSNKIYAIVLQLSSPKSLVTLQDIKIASLSLGEEVPVLFILKLAKPFPVSIEIRCMFTNEDGTTCTCLIQSFQISFNELYHVSPVDTSKVLLRPLFDLLWEKIESAQHSRLNPQNEGALSTMRLDVNITEFNSYLQKEISPKCIISTSQHEFDVLLFLPPQHHILLKLLSDKSSTVVKIACNSWKMLPFIGDWLKKLI